MILHSIPSFDLPLVVKWAVLGIQFVIVQLAQELLYAFLLVVPALQVF